MYTTQQWSLGWINGRFNVPESRIREKLVESTNISQLGLIRHLVHRVCKLWDKDLSINRLLLNTRLKLATEKGRIQTSDKLYALLLEQSTKTRWMDYKKDIGWSGSLLVELCIIYECRYTKTLVSSNNVAWMPRYEQGSVCKLANAKTPGEKWLNASVRKYNIRCALGHLACQIRISF